MPRKREPKQPAYRPKDVRAALRRAGELLVNETRYLNGSHFADPVKEHDFYWVGDALLRIADGKAKTLEVAFDLNKKDDRLAIDGIPTDMTISTGDLAWVRKVKQARYEGKGWPPAKGEKRRPVPWDRVANAIKWSGDVSSLRDRYNKLNQPQNIQASILEVKKKGSSEK